MRRLRLSAFGLVVFCVAALASAGQPLRLPRPLQSSLHYSPLEEAVFAAAKDGELGNDALLSAALVAGGVKDQGTLRHYAARYRRLADHLRLYAGDADESSGNQRERAADVFAFMHRRILTGSYDINRSQLSQVFDTGHYNCVSATILYNCLAAEVGLATCGGELPAHVVSIVKTAGGPLEIETTCPRWFELPDNSGQRRATRRKSQAIQRKFDTAELVALVYYNRGVDYSEQQRYPQAIAANYKAHQLDPASATARGNLLAAVNNWALDLAEDKKFDAAIDLLRQGRQMAPEHQTYSMNLLALHQQWVQSLCRDGRFARAVSVLERASREFPDERYFQSARQQVYRQWGEPLPPRHSPRKWTSP